MKLQLLGIQWAQLNPVVLVWIGLDSARFCFEWIRFYGVPKKRPT